MGSLTGAVASKRVTEALKVHLGAVRNRTKECKGRRWINCETDKSSRYESSTFQGLGCSPIKVVRELGSERRETVRSLSVAGVRYLSGAVLSTRGPGWTDRWCISCITKCIAE